MLIHLQIFTERRKISKEEDDGEVSYLQKYESGLSNVS